MYHNNKDIRLDKEVVTEKLKRFTDLVVDMLSPEKIVLYGSYARGNPHKFSDIDVAVVVSEIRGNILDIETNLFRLGSQIDVLIEPVLLEEKNDPSGFLEHVLSAGCRKPSQRFWSNHDTSQNFSCDCPARFRPCSRDCTMLASAT